MATQATNNPGMTVAHFEPKLWPISVEGKWGFIDAIASFLQLVLIGGSPGQRRR